MPSVAVVDVPRSSSGIHSTRTILQADPPHAAGERKSKQPSKKSVTCVVAKLDVIALRRRAICPGGFSEPVEGVQRASGGDNGPDHTARREAKGSSASTHDTDAEKEGGRPGGIDWCTAARREAWLGLLDLQHHFPSLVHSKPPDEAPAEQVDETKSLREHFANLLREEWEPREDRLTHGSSDASNVQATATESESDWQTALPRQKRRKERARIAGANASSDAGLEREGARSATASSSSFSIGASTTPTEKGWQASDTEFVSQTNKVKKKKKRSKETEGLARVKEHKDEAQVQLDVNRSFVGDAWSSLVPLSQRPHRRQQLSEVVVHVLRKYPALSYYQGYHDVISLLIVTLAPQVPHPPSENVDTGSSNLWRTAKEGEMLKDAASRLSLYWLRDFMSSGLEPALGALKVLRNLLRAVDPELARTVELASPLPYFALSWIISLLCHDLGPNESVRALDYFLCTGPVGAIYFTASLLLHQRDALLGLAEVDADPAELHHHLSQLVNSLAAPDAKTDGLSWLLSSASLMQNQYPLHSSAVEFERIMGPESVLRSFDQIKRQVNTEQWRERDRAAQRILDGPLDRIVLDYSPISAEDDLGSETQIDKTTLDNPARSVRTNAQRHAPTRGHTALLIAGALGAAGAVILYGASTGQIPPQIVPLLRSLAGRGRF